MEFEVTSAPTTEPIVTADVESYCQYGTLPTDQATAIAIMISAARAAVEKRLRRQLLTATWKAYLDEFPDADEGGQEIEIKDKLPITVVTSITYVDGNGATQTLAASAYQVDCASKQSPCRINPAYGTSWPDVRPDTPKAVCITFTAGYGAAAAVPGSIKLAILLLVANWVRNREAAGVSVNPLPFGFDLALEAEDWGPYS